MLALFVVGLLVIGKSDRHSQMGKLAGLLADALPKVGSSLDGTYANGDYDIPLKITIRGDSGSMDMGPLRALSMKVERHGDTVSLSGGTIIDAEGRTVEGTARNVLTGGDETNLFALGNDGQTLTSIDTDGSGRRVVFSKQP
jgi:hypothetical protein